MVRRMLRTVAAAACLLLAARAAAAAEWLEVLRTDESGVDVLLRAPDPVRDGDDWRVPEFDAFGEPGWPVTAEIAATFGVPDAAGARLRLLDVVWRELGRTTPARGGARMTSKVVSDGIGARTPEPVDFGAAYPSEPVTLSGTAELRGRHVVTLRYRPVQYRRDGNAVYAREVRARLEFESRPRPAPPGAAAEPLHAALANAKQAAAWARAATAARPTLPRTAALPASRLRLRIASRGIYALTRADLVAAGLSNSTLDGIDARTFRLYFPPWNTLPLLADSMPGSWQPDWEMTESALWITGEEDGNFGTEDRIQFYSLGPSGYEDLAGLSADSLQHARHPYDRSLYGWLVWGDGVFGARMQTRDATPGPTDSVRTRVWHREHFEEDQVYGLVDDLWAWQEIRASRAAIVNFTLDLGGALGATGRLRLGVGHGDPERRGARHGVLARLNGIEIGTARWQQSSSFGYFFDFPINNARPGSNTLNVSLLPDSLLLARAELLKFDVTWDRPLVADNLKTLGWSSRPDAGAETFGLTGFEAIEPLLLDVTEASRPRRLTGLAAVGSGTATQWRARTGAAGVRAHYLATTTPRRPAQLLLRNVANLRNRSTAPDMLIVTHETDTGGPTDLRAAALRLAAHRGTHWPGGGTPEIVVATTRDIYENFSGGRVDPLAIRNYAKFLYQLDATPRLRFLLLFGDGSHDPRQLLRGTSPTLVPALEPWVADARFRQEYAVEDWLGEMQTPNNQIGPEVQTSSAVPDLGVGRIAARSISEAQAIVDKIIAYEDSGPGVWRTRALLAADDECHNGACFESVHINNTETLAARTPSDLDPVKLYMTEYPLTLGQKPQARAAFIRAWNEGCVLLNYQGHGAPRQLSDEVLFLSTDIPSLQNGVKLPFFLPISCTVSEFDAPEQQSMCEDLLAYVPGGTIGSVGATTPTYVGPNFGFNLQLFRAVFEPGPTPQTPLGTILLLAKTRSPSGSGRFNETYMLIGDPSMPLGLTRAPVRFDSGVATLRTGERSTITGSVLGLDSLLASNFQGQADVEVFAHADTSGYRRPNVDYNLTIPYDLVGPPIYRGTVPVAGGHFSFQFHVPVGARLGTKGRVSAYAYDASGADAKGARSNVHVVTGSNTDSSLAAPHIVLSFPNGRTRVKAGTPLLATLSDANGINIQGTSLQNSILVDFDGLGEPVNVTSEFRYSSGSDSVGSLSVALPELNPGPHTVTLIASDNLLQTATETLQFEVLAEASVRLLNVLAFPNPFRDWTRFMFEITDPAEVEVEVFTTSGRRVWHGRQSFDAGAQGSIKWDGVDQGEDRLANGTYLYMLRARPTLPGSPELKYTGKVVLMR